ncbi:MAG: M48 family metallopeptidase, partial [Chitinophagaceae bacterium]|nr:M48 family metallopeptidase [Chitinophagaceae bacterium]
MPVGKKALIIFLFLTFSVYCQAQLKPVYKFQKDDTVLKRKLYDQSVQKKNTLVSSLSKENRDDFRKIYEQRLEQVEDLMLSPRSVTDSTAYHYLQAVLNKIITANPELKDIDARVVFTRDWWPNAYSIGDGTIAFNAGLLVFMNSEAELAFVLCHELAHYYLDHSGKAISKYVATINGEDFQKELKRLSKEQYRVNEQLEKLAKNIVFDNRRHSRDKEAEADRQAFIFMKRTGYDGMAVKTTLQLLDKIDDSTLFKPINLQQLLSFNEYPFKTKWVKKESVIFGEIGEDDGSGLTKKEKDSLKTHPDCAKRIALLEDSIRQLKGQLFLADKNMFAQLKKDFIAEITEQCFDNENLSRNLYYSLQLMDHEQYRPLAILSIVRAFNTLYEKQRDHKLGLTVDTENRYLPEDYNLLLRLLNRVRLEEIAAINYHFSSRYREEMKG